MTDGLSILLIFFFFNDTATTEIYTLSLHDALPISRLPAATEVPGPRRRARRDRHLLLQRQARRGRRDRKSTRLNSSHANISYAVFCLKKKKQSERFITFRKKKKKRKN